MRGWVEECELVVRGVMWEAFQEGCARCDGACVWTLVKFLELLKGCAPWVCGIEEGWVDVQGSHIRIQIVGQCKKMLWKVNDCCELDGTWRLAAQVGLR